MNRMRLGILFVFLICWRIAVAAPYPGCENCGCCVDQVCARAFLQTRWINDVCTYVCIPGIGGNKCYNKCPDDCLTCEQTHYTNCTRCEFGKYLNKDNSSSDFNRCVNCPATCTYCTSNVNCQECDDGYFNLGKKTNCSLKCPAKCKKCTSSKNCQECNSPFYNQGDITDCSLTCPSKCVRSSRICSACQDGYFNMNDHCTNACPDICKTCSDRSHCLSCIDGYYNGPDKSTDIKITNCSLPCRETCITCDSYNGCTQCKHGFTGNRCQSCLPGLHGDKCNKECPDNCKGNTCVQNTGECIACPDGFFGLFCESRCSPRCLGYTCDINSGACSECEPSYSGDKCCTHNGQCLRCSSHTECQTCVKGIYGDTCNKTCPTTCLNENHDLECDRSNGMCLTCRDGFYGDYCNLTCNIHCLTRRCLKGNGHCTEECIDGYEGPKCSEVADTARIDGVAIGISSAVMISMMIILASAFVLILKRRERKFQQRQAPANSYVNTELHPVSPDLQTDEQSQHDYEDTCTTNQESDTAYDQI